MLKPQIFCLLYLSVSSVFATDVLHKYQKDAACDQIDGTKIKNDTGRINILGNMVRFNVLKGNDINYQLLGDKKKISAKKQYYCEFPKLNAEDCLFGTGKYAFWESSSGYHPKLVSNWEEDGVWNQHARDFNYKPTSRGIKTITAVVTEKDFKTVVRSGLPDNRSNIPKGMTYEWPSFPYLQNNSWLNDEIWDGIESLISSKKSDGSIPDQSAYIPMCDAVEVRVQNKPTVSLVSLTNGSSIKVVVTPTIDEYSKESLEGDGVPSIRYTFYNESDGRGKTIVSNSRSMTYTPHNNGPIRVTAKVFDGTFYSK